MRLFLVGMRKDIPQYRNFQWPRCLGPPLRLEEVLDNCTDDGLLADHEELRTSTEKRKWARLVEKWAASKESLAVPTVCDLGASEAFGTHSTTDSCPTITRTRASSFQFWVAKKVDDRFLHRRIRVHEYGKLQGWPEGEIKHLKAAFSDRQLGGYFGNGFSFNVIQALLNELVLLDAY